MAVTSSVLHIEALQTRRNVPRCGGGGGAGGVVSAVHLRFRLKRNIAVFFFFKASEVASLNPATTYEKKRVLEKKVLVALPTRALGVLFKMFLKVELGHNGRCNDGYNHARDHS